MAFRRPWSFSALVARLQARGWFGFGRSRTATEDAFGEANVEIGGHMCTVAVAADAKAKLLTVIVTPPFSVEDRKAADALVVVNELNCRISEGRFVLFRDHDGYRQLRYWHSVPQCQLVSAEAIADLVGLAGRLYEEWLPVLVAASVTDESAEAVLHRIMVTDRSRHEVEKRAAGIPIVITHDDYQERLGQFLDASHPSDASSYSAYLLWVKNQTQEFHSLLQSQGIQVEDAADASSSIPSWDGRTNE